MRHTYYLFTVAFLLISSLAFANGPGKGELTVWDQGAIHRIDVRYNLSQMMGEPVVNGSFRWESKTVSKLSYDVVLWLTVETPAGNTAYIKIDPVVPKEGEWAYNVSGSPNWNQVLATGWNGTEATGYYSASEAKAFWKTEFRVVDAKLSKIFR
ncbi:MAG: hypothetical protein LWX56_15375 [Ignavibacteria bacterium]|nr:hypothetical protein [Ignavibacteria bacterium]